MKHSTEQYNKMLFHFIYLIEKSPIKIPVGKLIAPLDIKQEINAALQWISINEEVRKRWYKPVWIILT